MMHNRANLIFSPFWTSSIPTSTGDYPSSDSGQDSVVLSNTERLHHY